MAAGSYNFTIEAGTTMEIPLVWKDPSNNPYNLTGYTARMQARPSIDSTTVLHEWTTENGGITITPAEGKIVLAADDTETASWQSWTVTPPSTSPTAVYDLEVISGSGFVTRLLEGTITIKKEVTRT